MNLFQFLGGVTLTTLPPGFSMGRGGAFLGVTLDALGGGLLEVPIGFICVKTICSVGGGLGGVRYQIGRPNIKPRRLRVSITAMLMIPDGGNKKGIC